SIRPLSRKRVKPYLVGEREQLVRDSRPSALTVLRLTRKATSSRSLQFSDAKRLKCVDRAGILLMIVELEKSDGDSVDREVDKDEAVLLDRFEVLFHLQMHGWCRPDTAEC